MEYETPEEKEFSRDLVSWTNGFSKIKKTYLHQNRTLEIKQKQLNVITLVQTESDNISRMLTTTDEVR